jgi:ferredoxin, 2Fe-2S
MKPIATQPGFDHERSRDRVAMHRVTLHPDARSVEVRHGERLLNAAWKTGVGIKSVCGGRGKCGSCIVEIDAADAGALSPPDDAESGLLPPHPDGGTYRLACLCEVQGDVTI